MNSRAERFLKNLMKTPEYQAEQARQDDQLVANRSGMVEKIDALRKALANDLAPAHKLVEKERAAWEKAKKALLAREMTWNATRIELANLNTRTEAEIGRIETRLQEDCNPGIAPFVDGLLNLWDHERRDWSWSHPNDSTSARVRIDQINDVRERAEALRYEPDRERAEAALQALKAEIETPQEVAVA